MLALFFIKKTTVLISPRGQLLKGAISNRKIWYLAFYKFLLKLSGHKIIFHFTHQKEKIKSYPIFINFESIIFPNSISRNISNPICHIIKERKFVIGCLGRLVPIKNIEFLIEMLPKLNNKISLQIHGVEINKKYKQKLIDRIEFLGVKERVGFFSDYTKENVAKRMQKIDLIAIPSNSENFCHVFFEAIAAGKLVLASTGLPWNKANEYNRNTILPLDKNLWLNRIETISKMSVQEYQKEQEQLVFFYNDIQQNINKEILGNFKKLLLQN